MEEHLPEIKPRLKGDDEVGFLDPCLKRGMTTQTAVGVAVVLAFQPPVKPPVKLGDACQLRGIKGTKELFASRSEEPFDLPSTTWTSYLRMHENDAEGVENTPRLHAHKSAAMIGIQSPDASVGGKDVFDARFEGK